MRSFLHGTDSPHHAITDLYDEERRSFLVRYPVWLIVALALAGVVAFMAAGFLGYRDTAEPALTAKLFHQPWPIYLWFCALIMTLQISILRHPSLRRQMVATLIVTVFCIIFVGVTYYYNKAILDWLNSFLSYILGQHIILRLIGDWPWTYTFINFAIIAIFWADTLRRWVRRARGKTPTRRVDLETGEVTREFASGDEPTMQELISGDLIAGAVLCLLLAIIFRDSVMSFFSQALNVGINIQTCTVSWPIGACVPPGGGLHDPPTLTFIDLIQALVYLPLGLLILALSATLSGLGAVGGVDERQIGQQEPEPIDSGESSTESVADQVSLTVINTLRSALNRRIRIAAGSLALSLRNAVWPALILLGTISVAASSRYIQFYLHLLSDQRTCATPACPEYHIVQGLLGSWQQYQAVVLALVWGLIAVLSIVFSVTLLIFRRRVAENTLRFLGLIGFIILLTFWIFSLALSGFNGLFSLTHLSERVPFPQPGLSTIISALSLVIFGVLVLTRRVRGRRGGDGGRVPEPVRATHAE